MNGVCGGNFKAENCCEAGALPFSILSVSLYTCSSKVSFGGTQAEDTQENTAEKELSSSGKVSITPPTTERV